MSDNSDSVSQCLETTGQTLESVVLCDNLSNIGAQLDGNESLSSSQSDSINNIPENRVSNENDRITSALNLPTLATYNCRSLFPKLGNVRTDILERSIDVAFLCEIWQKKENKNHQAQIETLLETEGLKYISTPRPSGWGGAGIIVHQRKFTVEKLNIFIPHNLEVVWGLLRPKDESATYKEIIICSFYSPPNSKKNTKLTDHLVTTLQMLHTQYPDSPLMLGADKNKMDIRPLLNCGLRLRQVVDLPTRNGVILDILLISIPQFYDAPIVVPPVPCDNPSDGVPSDHWVPVCVPHTDRSRPPVRRYRTVTYRPLPESSVRQFGKWITSEKFSEIDENLSPSEHARALEKLLLDNLDKYCPEKTMRLGPQDKPWMNYELKCLSRKKQREWVKYGKSDKYKCLEKQFKSKYEAAAQKYMEDKVTKLKETQPGKAYKVFKSMGARPGDCTDNGTFSLPNHQNENLTDQECAEKIAEHFASISGEYAPADVEKLPERVKSRLRTKSKPPVVTEYDCYMKMKAAKKPTSGVPGELPSAIVKEFTAELANPVSKLINNVVQSASWPEQYKMEYVTPIGKIPQPQSEDDLRPISLTNFFSKMIEHFVVMWLLSFIWDKIDFRQYGGTKGNSVSHYLIELINFILYCQDDREPTAVLACLVDFEKAFNRQDHSILITKLSDMDVPSWLLLIIISFLEKRSMRVRYKGKTSDPKWLPGGGPQGTLLGLLLFLILINDVGFPDQRNNVGDIITSKKRTTKVEEIHLKFVDDLTIGEAIKMKEMLNFTPVEGRPQPDHFHAKTGHTLQSNKSRVFDQLGKISQYASDNGMRLNYKKTKFILFNPCTSKDFLPEFTLDGHEIEAVDETRLLGLVIRNDLSWSSNTDSIIERCNQKLWFLRRLKGLGASRNDLNDLYHKHIRSILEYAAPVWHSSLTGEDRLRLERVQKSALHIMLGEKYKSYSSALRITGNQTLFERRRKLCIKFARKSLKSEKFKSWFKPNAKHTNTRQDQTKLCEVYSRLDRFETSPISYLTNLLNNDAMN